MPNRFLYSLKHPISLSDIYSNYSVFVLIISMTGSPNLRDFYTILIFFSLYSNLKEEHTDRYYMIAFFLEYLSFVIFSYTEIYVLLL